jgi:hypothetical protein
MKSDNKTGRLLGVKGARFSTEIDAELLNRAEKELAAFVAAVATLHGEEQARAAADDWLLELMALNWPCKGASLNLRSVTIAAARRLALRLSIPSRAAIQISVQENTSPPQRRGKHSTAQENVTHATAPGKTPHAALAALAGILLHHAPANAHGAHSSLRHLLTQPANVVVIRWRSVSGKHEFSKIPTIRARIRTTRSPMCSLLTVSEPRPNKSGTPGHIDPAMTTFYVSKRSGKRDAARGSRPRRAPKPGRAGRRELAGLVRGVHGGGAGRDQAAEVSKYRRVSS